MENKSKIDLIAVIKVVKKLSDSDQDDMLVATADRVPANSYACSRCEYRASIGNTRTIKCALCPFNYIYCIWGDHLQDLVKKLEELK